MPDSIKNSTNNDADYENETEINDFNDQEYKRPRYNNNERMSSPYSNRNNFRDNKFGNNNNVYGYNNRKNYNKFNEDD